MGAYAFNEGSGTTVDDASGNGNNGTISNATWVSDGKYGGALQFNGSSSLVTIPNTASLQLTSGMTLEAWVDPSTISSAWRDVVYKGNDNYYLSASSTDSGVVAGGAIVGGKYDEAYDGSSLPTGTWSYLALTYDGSELRLYVNGSLVSEHAQSGSIETSSDPLQIGGDSLYGQHFSGLIDEVRVYDTPLSVSQIQSDMNTPIAAPVAIPPTVTSTSTTPAAPQPPSAPGTLTASAASPSEIDLSWGAATDSAGVSKYLVERCQGTGCSNFTQIGTSTTTSYADTTVAASTTYSYRVRASDAAGNLGPYANVVSLTSPAAPSTAPVPATSLPVLFDGDLSTGDFSQWEGFDVDGCGNGTATIESQIVPPGYSHAADVVDPPCSTSLNRIELEGRSVPYGSNTQVSFWFYIDPSTTFATDSRFQIAQWHPYVDSCYGGGLGIQDDGTMKFEFRGGQVTSGGGGCQFGGAAPSPSNPYDQTWVTGPVTKGEWYHVVMDVNWSGNPNVGYAQVWVNGQQVVPFTQMATMSTGPTGTTPRDFRFRQGIYRTNPFDSTTTVYVGGMTVYQEPTTTN